MRNYYIHITHCNIQENNLELQNYNFESFKNILCVVGNPTTQNKDCMSKLQEAFETLYEK